MSPPPVTHTRDVGYPNENDRQGGIAYACVTGSVPRWCLSCAHLRNECAVYPRRFIPRRFVLRNESPWPHASDSEFQRHDQSMPGQPTGNRTCAYVGEERTGNARSPASSFPPRGKRSIRAHEPFPRHTQETCPYLTTVVNFHGALSLFIRGSTTSCIPLGCLCRTQGIPLVINHHTDNTPCTPIGQLVYSSYRDP